MTHVKQTPVHVQLVSCGAGQAPRGAELPSLTGVRHLSVVETTAVVTTRAEGDDLTVLLTGVVDATSTGALTDVLATVGTHVARHPRARVHVDVREATSVDSGAVRFLERLRDACVHHGASCTTSSGRPAVEAVLALARPVADGALAAS